ncbi:hypothetical protein H4582DRAFT_1326226 [Lactarius indigo]|nr:hypothetical protein H4582DRAFT_1326226 [Lactarius indigo]
MPPVSLLTLLHIVNGCCRGGCRGGKLPQQSTRSQDARSWISCSCYHHRTFLGVLTTSSIRCPAPPVDVFGHRQSFFQCMRWCSRCSLSSTRFVPMTCTHSHILCLCLWSPVSCVCRLTSYHVASYFTLALGTLCAFPCYSTHILP